MLLMKACGRQGRTLLMLHRHRNAAVTHCDITLRRHFQTSQSWSLCICSCLQAGVLQPADCSGCCNHRAWISMQMIGRLNWEHTTASFLTENRFFQAGFMPQHCQRRVIRKLSPAYWQITKLSPMFSIRTQPWGWWHFLLREAETQNAWSILFNIIRWTCDVAVYILNIQFFCYIHFRVSGKGHFSTKQGFFSLLPASKCLCTDTVSVFYATQVINSLSASISKCCELSLFSLSTQSSGHEKVHMNVSVTNYC